jgi:hypothetical protein
MSQPSVAAPVMTREILTLAAVVVLGAIVTPPVSQCAGGHFAARRICCGEHAETSTLPRIIEWLIGLSLPALGRRAGADHPTG